MSDHLPPRYLRPSKTTRIPSSVVVWYSTGRPIKSRRKDRLAETHRCTALIHVRRESGQWCRRKEAVFCEPSHVWEWLRRRMHRGRPLWCIAPNMGRSLTWLHLWEDIEAGRWRMKDPAPPPSESEDDDGVIRRPWRGSMIISDPPTVVALRCDEGGIRLLDTANYVRHALAEWRAADGSAPPAEPTASARPSEWRDYTIAVARTVADEILGMMAAWEKADAGPWQSTAAALSYSSYKRVAPSKTILIDHRPDHTAVARQSYYGGEARADYVGTYPARSAPKDTPAHCRPDIVGVGMASEVYHLDVASLYPAIMREHPMPCRFLSYWPQQTVKQLVSRMRTACCAARVHIVSRDMAYPVRVNGETVYATGSYWTYLCGVELERACERGHVVRCGEVSVYAQGAIFSKWVDRVWSLRRDAETKGDAVAVAVWKMVANGLSGKWAQKKQRWVDRPDVVAPVAWGGWIDVDADDGTTRHFRAIASQTQQQKTGGEGRGAFCIISAAITSAARERMRAYRELMPAKTVLYQDTDSLFCLADGYDALLERGLIKEGEFGHLRLQGVYPSMTIHALKDYEIGGERTMAGVMPSAIEIAPRVFEQTTQPRLEAELTARPDGTTHKVPVTFDLSHSRLGSGEGRWAEPIRIEPEPF